MEGHQRVKLFDCLGMDSDATSTYDGDNYSTYIDGEQCETFTHRINNAAGSNANNSVNFTFLRPIEYSVPVYGVITPLLFIITFFTNTIVVAVLSRPHMKSPTNFILCAISISDLLTLGIPVPMFFYQYTLGYYSHPVACFLAHLNHLMTDVIPTVCHSASVWLTLLLAIQRYIYVCHPTRARSWCTLPRVTYATVGIYCTAVIYNIPRLFENDFFSLPFVWNCQLVTQCFANFLPWVSYYFPFFFWFRVICVNCVPCILLVMFNTLLVISLNKNRAKRKRLLSERKQESSKQRDSNCTTMMLVAVVCVFLVVELPLACVVLLVIVENTWELQILGRTLTSSLITFSNLCIGLSYIIYFPIYCSMSRQFRETFKELFVKAKQLHHETLRNGKTTATTASNTRRNTYLTTALAYPGEETCYLSNANDVDCGKTVVAQMSTTMIDEDEAEAPDRETETLL